MSQLKSEWHPLSKLIYWILFTGWIFFVLTFYAAPGGLLGNLAEKVLNALHPQYITLVVNTFSLMGAYIVTRFILSLRVGWNSFKAETSAAALFFFIAITSLSLIFARCDVYVFCADDLSTRTVECDAEWDKQGQHCK